MRRTLAALVAALLPLAAFPASAGAAEPPATAPTDTAREAAEEAERERARQGAPKAGAKDWAFGLYTGVQYDDNATLRNRHVDVGDERTDWKSVNALFVDYRLVNTDDRILGLRYNAYQTVLDSHKQLQLTGNTITLHHTEIHAPFVLDLPASFTHYDLYGDAFLNLSSFAPALYLEESAHLVGVLRGAARRFDYTDLPDSGCYEPDRSAHVYEAGLEQWLLFGERGQYRLEAGYSFRHENARENVWTNDAGEARLALRGELPWWRLGLDLSATYTEKVFERDNPLFEATERDRAAAYGLAVSRPIMAHATATLSYLYTDHQSNVESQEYRRNQITLGVTVLF